MRAYAPRVELTGTEEASRTNLAIPMSPGLTREQADEVVAAAGALAAA
jgi:dTDP-4-amino-4,6-dideoxygalactose transaminase